MNSELLIQYMHVPTLVLVAARISGFVMFMPLVGGTAVPQHVQALLVIGLAALLTPLVGVQRSAPASLAELGLAIAAELALGALIGMTVRMCFFGLQLGGQLLAQETGLAF